MAPLLADLRRLLDESAAELGPDDQQLVDRVRPPADPRRLADTWLALHQAPAETPLAEVRDRDLIALARQLQHWRITPSGP